MSMSVTGNFGRERFVQVGMHSSFDFLWGRRETLAWTVGAGISDVGRWHRTAVAIGPALVTGERRKGGDWGRFVTGGVVLNAQVFVTPVKEVGLGLNLFANANPVDVSYGLGLALIFEANK